MSFININLWQYIARESLRIPHRKVFGLQMSSVGAFRACPDKVKAMGKLSQVILITYLTAYVRKLHVYPMSHV